MASISKPMQHGKRLFELLEEQQEPFLLDVYLLEHGYSDRRVKPQDTVCWPWSAASKRLRRLGLYGFKRRRSCHGILRFALDKVVRKTLFACDGSSALGSRTWSSVLGHRKVNVVDFRRLSHSGAIDEEMLHCAKSIDNDDESKQLSPVSVLQLHSDEASPAHTLSVEEGTTSASTMYSALDFEELMCSTAALFAHEGKEFSRLRQSDVVFDCVGEVDDKLLWDYNDDMECSNADKLAIEEEKLFWEKQLKGLASISQIIHSDIAKSKQEWSQFEAERREIVLEIETKIFSEIREETMLAVMLDYHCTLQTRC